MSELSDFRKKLHAAPELLRQEKYTAEKNYSELKKHKPSKVITGLKVLALLPSRRSNFGKK